MKAIEGGRNSEIKMAGTEGGAASRALEMAYFPPFCGCGGVRTIRDSQAIQRRSQLGLQNADRSSLRLARSALLPWYYTDGGVDAARRGSEEHLSMTAKVGGVRWE